MPDSVPMYTVAGVVARTTSSRASAASGGTPATDQLRPPSLLEYKVPRASANSPDGDQASTGMQEPAPGKVNGWLQLAPPSADTQTLQLVVAATTLSPSPGSTTMDCARAVGPEPVAVQAAPPFVLFQTRFSVAPYRTPGAEGEAASARTCAAEGPSAVQVFGGPAGAEKAEPANKRTTARAQMRRRITEKIGALRPAVAPQKRVVDPAIDITATNTGAVTVTLSGAPLRVDGEVRDAGTDDVGWCRRRTAVPRCPVRGGRG